MELDPITYSLCYLIALLIAGTEKFLEFIGIAPETVGFGWVILIWIWFFALIMLAFLGLIEVLEYSLKFFSRSIKRLSRR